MKLFNACNSINILVWGKQDCITSVLRYFGPTLTWFFSSLKLLLVRCTVGRIHTSLKKVSVSDLLQVICSALISWLHSSVGRMHNICRSDAQHQQVGCTTLVGRMHNFCRSDTQLLQVRCTHFVVGCTHFVGLMHICFIK